MGLPLTFFEINGDFSQKSQTSSVYFASTLKGFPLELGISALKKKLEWWGYRAEKEILTISSAVWIQYSNVTDRRTDTERQQRPRLIRIVSRGKKWTSNYYNGLIANFAIKYIESTFIVA